EQCESAAELARARQTGQPAPCDHDVGERHSATHLLRHEYACLMKCLAFRAHVQPSCFVADEFPALLPSTPLPMSEPLQGLLHLVRRHKAGTVLFREGDPGDRMFVIRAGKVNISKRISDREMTLAVLGPGEFFGEMALLERLP